MYRRIRTAMGMGAREFQRTPVLIALLAVLPAYVIGAFVALVPDRSLPVTLGETTKQVHLTDFAAALMTPVTVGILSGIVGLFLVQAARSADDRLRLAGFGATELVVARIGTLVLGTVVVTAASVFVALLAFSPASPGLFVGATVLVGLTYGTIGVIVGLLMDPLGGIYVLLFTPMIDILMFQIPLATDRADWTMVMPSHFATNVLFDAAFADSVAATDLVGAGFATLAFLVVGIAVFYQATDLA